MSKKANVQMVPMKIILNVGYVMHIVVHAQDQLIPNVELVMMATSDKYIVILLGIQPVMTNVHIDSLETLNITNVVFAHLHVLIVILVKCVQNVMTIIN